MSLPTRPHPQRMGKEKRLALQQEVLLLLRKGTIEPVRDRQAGFYSNFFGRSPDRSFRLPQVGSPTSLLLPGQERQESSRDQRPSTTLELQQDVRFTSSSVDSSSSGEDKGDQRSFAAQVTPFWTRSVWLAKLQCYDVYASFQLIRPHLLKVDQPFFVCFVYFVVVLDNFRYFFVLIITSF